MQKVFDELHVVSDLHLGGETGFQIFDQGPELAALLRHLAALPATRVGLVLNGDIVDFLAEESARYLDPAGAVAKLERIFTDPPFANVWQALADFLAHDGRELILVLGNHDVELALPAVRERLLEELCRDSAAARGRVTLAMDGAGFACQVADRSVLCLHGNEVDTWNIVDYEALLHTQRALNRRREMPDWTPNAGTKLVIDMMNRVKRRYPFVDLLKPETRAVPAMLLALQPQLVGQLRKFSAVASRLAIDSVRRSLGFLSADDDADSGSGDESIAMRELLAAGYDVSHTASATNVDELLDRVEAMVEQSPDRPEATDDDEMLGMTGAIIDRIRKRSPAENLRESLSKWLGDDKTFDMHTKDKTFRKLDEAVGTDVDFVVAGHTHLERALSRQHGSGAYFNSGTWIRLIQIDKKTLASAKKFKAVFDRIEAGTMQALDEPPGLILRRATVVSIEPNGPGVAGELRHVTLDAAGEAQLTPVAGSRLVR